MTQSETLRWPTNLDRAGIELRLVQVRDYALANGLPEIATYFENLPRLGSAQLPYPFTAPVVSPAMKSRCKMKNSTAIGKIASSVPAIKIPYSF